MAVTNDAQIWAVLGSSGCGKGLWIKQQLRKLKPKRLIILDTKDENGEFADQVQTIADVGRASLQKSFKVRYVPKGETKQGRQDEFQALCKIAARAKNLVFLVEELGRYTSATWAPPAWADCCNDGRHDGMHIIAASQDPAQLDKRFLGSCTIIHCGYLGVQSHRKVVAECMDIEPDRIKALPDLHYLHFDKKQRTVTSGVVKIPTSKRL